MIYALHSDLSNNTRLPLVTATLVWRLQWCALCTVTSRIVASLEVSKMKQEVPVAALPHDIVKAVAQ